MTTSPGNGTVHVDHVFTVPLDHDRPDDRRIQVYAREVRAAGRPAAIFPGCCSWAAAPDRPPLARSAVRAG